CCQRTGDGGTWSDGSLRGEEDVSRLLEAALEKLRVAEVGNLRPRAGPDSGGNVKATDRIKKKQRPDTLVKVVARAPETVKRFALSQQFFKRRRPAKGIEGQVAGLGVAGRNDVDKGGRRTAHCVLRVEAAPISRSASSWSIAQSTSSRSHPSRARA